MAQAREMPLPCHHSRADAADWTGALPAGDLGVRALDPVSSQDWLDDVMISRRFGLPRLSTLPVGVFHNVERRAEPQVCARSVVPIVVTSIAVLPVEREARVVRAVDR